MSVTHRDLEASGKGRSGKQRKSRTTLKKDLGHVRGLFDWACGKGYVDANPFADVQPRPENRQASSSI